MSTSIRSTMFMLIGLVLGIGCTIAGDFDQKVDRQFKVGKGGTLRLQSDLGSVKVSTHSRDEVSIEVTMTANTGNRGTAEDWFEAFELKFDQSGKDVEVIGAWAESWGRRNNRLRITYDIIVPNEYNLDITTAGGSISVDDLDGTVVLKTSGGSINVGEIKGTVTAKTSGGSIDVRKTKGEAVLSTSGGSIDLGDIAGPVDARTSGGGIRADRVDGDVVAHTSGGSINLKYVNGSVNARTSGGSIHTELQKPVTEAMELRTSGGGISLTVPADFKADLDASTSGGRVKTDLPVTVQGTISKNKLRGQVNGGGPKVVLRTSGGNIEIRENSGI